MAEDHEVQQGESIGSIAFERGFFWETIWNHSANSALKEKRKDPDVLMAGDVVHIPDITLKQQSAAAESKHRFKRKGVPGKLVLVLRRSSKKVVEKAEEGTASDCWDFREPEVKAVPDEPDANAPYVLYADGVEVAKGTTDGNGRLEAKLSPAARNGVLVLRRGTPQERTLELNFRHMDPIAELPGICKRLVNLGYPCPTDSKELTSDVRAALSSFQRANSLKVTGEPDAATQSKLKELHGG